MDRYRVGFDIGGTFTDFVLFDAEKSTIRTHKCLTTPGNPAMGALEGLKELCLKAGISLSQIAELVHGTTLVTNALIERRGARTGLLTTRGFRDALEMGTEQRYDIFDLFARLPEPLVPRQWRMEVTERIDADGMVVHPMVAQEVLDRVGWLDEQGVESIAITFLHSYRNPVHERAARAIIEQRYPHLTISISSEVAPEIREFPRTSTTVANAYVQPITVKYLDQLAIELARAGFQGRLFLMHSGGGLVLPEEIKAFPIRLLESGPAGGAAAAAYMAALAGHGDLLAFDMGGTTAKACLIRNGRPDIAFETEVGRVHLLKKGSGLPVRLPTIDMIEIGAGGGSIAFADSLGLLQVGPRSAGASPGPACYGRGGTAPTVTDANLLLGYLNPGSFLGGRMRLDWQAAERAVGTLAERLGRTTTEIAWGIYSIVSENMAAAVRTHIVEKGQDPRRFLLVAFGGAGPACAVRVARSVGCSDVLVPWATGAASALGFLLAPVALEVAQSRPTLLSEVDWNDLNGVLEGLEERARATLSQASVAHGDMVIERFADMRLAGQVHDIRVEVPGGVLGPAHRVELEAAFKVAYEHLYSYVPTGISVQAMTWRVAAAGPGHDLRFTPEGVPIRTTADSRDATDGKVSEIDRRPAFFPEQGGYAQTPVYSRYDLVPGDRIDGPAIIEENEATTIIAPGDWLTVEPSLALRVRVASATVKVDPSAASITGRSAE